MARRITLFIFTLTLLSIAYGVQKLPQPIINDMASREMRHHHVLWHNIRNSWNRLDNATQQALRALGWACPHPSQMVNEQGRVVPLPDNLSGEDFLYMHRQMLQRAKKIGDAMNPPFVWPKWDVLPPPTDPEFPVPPVYTAETAETQASINTWKTEDTYWNVIKGKDAKFKSARYLQNVTLSQLGSAIEYELHNGIHMRWSDIGPLGLRVRPPNPVPYIDPKWDNATYDWLIDSYSSQVNMYFYYIHYWIDARVDDWMKANGITELKWNGTWVGGPMSRVNDLVQVGKDHNLKVEGDEIPAPNLRGSEHNMDMMDMDHGDNAGVKTENVYEEVFKILANAGIPDHYFYDMVTYDEDGISPETKQCD